MFAVANRPPQVPEYLTPKQTSETIGVQLQTLAAWRSSGRYGLPFVRVGRLIRYRRSDVQAWLESRRVAGAVD